MHEVGSCKGRCEVAQPPSRIGIALRPHFFFCLQMPPALSISDAAVVSGSPEVVKIEGVAYDAVRALEEGRVDGGHKHVAAQHHLRQVVQDLEVGRKGMKQCIEAWVESEWLQALLPCKREGEKCELV